jgi:AmmeMemoRadiSam system protein B
MSPRVRPAAVAGMFYPGDAVALHEALRAAFAGARRPESEEPAPKALIAPHAGYVYSGAIAASAYLRVQPLREQITRVVLVGPSHRVPLRGLAVPSVDALETPLGAVPVDSDARTTVLALPQVAVDDRPHMHEHSLEVHLPFLQTVLDDVLVLPLAVGRATAEEVADVLDAVWGGPETLVVVSTDLSHYHDQATAVRLDRRTADAVVAGTADAIDDYDACGAYGVRGLLVVAARRGLSVRCVDLRTSGDTAGSDDHVVGYGAFVLS